MWKGHTAYASRLMFKGNNIGSTWSGKRFRIEYDNFTEAIYSPLLGESESEEERRNLSMPRGVSQWDNQGSFWISHPTNPSPPSPPPHTPTPSPQLPPFKG